MEQKIKNWSLFLAVILIAVLGYFYQSNITPVDNVEQEVVGEEINIVETDDNSVQSTKNPLPPVDSSVGNLPSVTGDGVYLVYYFDDGFYPNNLQIRQGTSVRFINKSNNSMRIFTSNDQEYRFNPLNQTQTVGKGGTYDFTFVEKDLWEYFNYNEQNHRANILVY